MLGYSIQQKLSAGDNMIAGGQIKCLVTLYNKNLVLEI